MFSSLSKYQKRSQLRNPQVDQFIPNLNVCVELYEAIGPGGGVDLVTVLTVELPRQVLQKAISGLLAKLPLSEG